MSRARDGFSTKRVSTAVINSSHSTDRGVMAFTPKRLDIAMTASASDFVRHEVGDDSGFHINASLAEQTGIATARAKDVEDGLELRLLEKLKTVEEEAYQRGFEQGVADGKAESLAVNNATATQRLLALDELSKRISSLISGLVMNNEAQLVDLVYYLAKTIAFRDVKSNPEAIKEVIKTVSQSIQTDTNVNLRISPDDMATIEHLKTATDQHFEYLQKIKIFPDPSISRGGCIIETNSGMIDATLETRFEKVWDAIQEKKPNIHDVIE